MSLLLVVGHAGAEAAHCVGTFKVHSTACITMSRALGIGRDVPVTLAIGGLGKGHLVREIDANGRR